MQEHEIEVGTIGELEPAELAVADYPETGCVPFAVDFVMGRAMLAGKIEPG